MDMNQFMKGGTKDTLQNIMKAETTGANVNRLCRPQEKGTAEDISKIFIRRAIA